MLHRSRDALTKLKNMLDNHQKADVMGRAELPSIFVSHGAPDLVLQQTDAHRFLKKWGAEIGKPTAILIVGSASFTHNLGAVFGRTGLADRDAAAPHWVTEFPNWTDDRLSKGALEDLLAYRQFAPFAEKNHPTDEHLLPFYVALGAAGRDASATQVHRSHQFGAIMMDAYAFSPAVETALEAKTA
uniref:DODA-type extradiol aromatic ring-opening family dioxygenase n=1 Tax=Pararhizobium sp. IMCC3301 TaxID=3067904 RepID=UPI0027423EB1|nr:hypothetical protein [Pararhizobium sp. IMCC3301]